jgi:dihydropyrimidinase
VGVGADADVVVFDPAVNWVVHANDLHMATDYTPYEGLSARGRPTTVISRGDVIVDGGIFSGAAGRGQFVPRSIDQNVLARLLG